MLDSLHAACVINAMIDIHVPGPIASHIVLNVNAQKKLVYLIVDFFCFSGGNMAMTVLLVSPR